MSLVSKDSKTTLNKLRLRNEGLKIELAKCQARNGDGVDVDLERNPLFRTVRESNSSLTHFGSTSWAALIDTEPVLKAIVSQMHLLMKHQRDEYDSRKKSHHDKEMNMRPVMKGRTLLSQMGLEREDHLDFIKEMLQQVEDLLPSGEMIVHFLDMYKNYNAMKALGTFLVDFDSLNQAVLEFINVDLNGKATFNIQLPRDLDKMSHVLLFLSSLSFMIFLKNQVTVNNEGTTDVNYLVFLEFVDALFTLLHNYLAANGALRLLYTVETFQALFISGTFQNYVPHGNMIDDSEGAKTAVYMRKMVSLGKLLNLNKNIDVYYAHKSPQMRKSLKSLWYAVSSYDSLESLEIGIPPKIKVSFLRYDDFTSPFTETSITMNQVLKLYYEIELMKDTNQFIDIIENQIIKTLKDLLRNHFSTLEKDVEVFQNYDFSHDSSSHDFFTRGQSFSTRCLIYSTIQTFYHICYHRLKIVNETDSQRFKRITVLTWKYTLLVPFVMKELFKGYNRLVRHENSDAFFPVASLLMSVFPYMRLAQRRIAIFASARFMETFNYDQVSKTAKIFFYQSDNRENEIYEMLSDQGLYQKEYNLSDYSNLEIDDNPSELHSKFKELSDNKHIIVILAKTMKSSIQLLSNDRYNFNFVTYNYIFFFLLKMSNFFLNQAFPNTTFISRSNKSTPSSSTHTEFDFNELFEKAIDTRSQKFDYNNFFTNSYSSTFHPGDNNNQSHTRNDMLNDFFASLDIPGSSNVPTDSNTWFKHE